MPLTYTWPPKSQECEPEPFHLRLRWYLAVLFMLVSMVLISMTVYLTFRILTEHSSVLERLRIIETELGEVAIILNTWEVYETEK